MKLDSHNCLLYEMTSLAVLGNRRNTNQTYISIVISGWGTLFGGHESEDIQNFFTKLLNVGF